MTNWSSRQKLFLAVVSVLAAILGAGAAIFFMTILQRPEITWDQAFNKEHGTALGIDIHEGSQQHLVQFDFAKNQSGQVVQYELVACWADAGDSRLKEDAWAYFDDKVRRYGNAIKLTVKNAPADPKNDRPRQVMVVTLLPYPQPLTPQKAQEEALRVIGQLKQYSPCKRS